MAAAGRCRRVRDDARWDGRVLVDARRDGGTRVDAGRRGAGRRRRPDRPRPARGRADRPGPPGAGGDPAGTQLRPATTDDHLRGVGLHRRAGRSGAVPRLPGDGLRCPSGVHHRAAVPRRRRGGRRLAAPLPGGTGGRRSAGPTHSPLRPDPRPEVRRAAVAGRVGPTRGLRRRDGFAAQHGRPVGPATRCWGAARRTDPAVRPDRARPWCPYAAGDRGERRRRDHRGGQRPIRRPADRWRRPHPPLRRHRGGPHRTSARRPDGGPTEPADRGGVVNGR